MQNNLPFVSTIIPCHNEEKFIGMCLDSIIANDHPKDKLEVLIVDGMSEDKTKEIVGRYVKQYSFIKVLENPKKIIPVAFNIGIEQAKGEVIMIMSAHTTYKNNYISKCIEYLQRYNVDNVGGRLKIIPGKNTLIAKAITLVLSHPFASGNAYIKIGSKEPRCADTVAFGCYKKEVFQKIGLFNEKLVGSSDMDFNNRLRRAGGKILLVPEIVANYYAEPNLRAFWRHNFADGVWATYVLKYRSKAFSWRHWIPLIFILGLLGSGVLSSFFFFRWLFTGFIGTYALLNLLASLHLAIRERQVVYLWTAPIVFMTRHFAHGLGALWGLLLMLIPGVHWRGRRGRNV